MEKKKSAGLTFLAILLLIVTLPFVLVGLLVFGLIYFFTTVLFAPIEVIIYKKSDFYRDFQVKYFLGALRHFGYKTYPYVKGNPRLTLVFQGEGYYYYKTEDAVLVIPYYEGFYLHNGEWYADADEADEEEPKLKVTDLKSVFEPLIKEDISALNLKLLVTEKLFKKDELETAKADPVFVFYAKPCDFGTIPN